MEKGYGYSGYAWIDFGRTTLWKNFRKLTLEWDSWTAGGIQGSSKIIEQIASRDPSLKIVDYWRWSEYDENIER